MKKTGALLLLIASIVTINIAKGQTVEELQAKYIAALGGKEKIESLKNVVQEGNMEVMGMQMPAKIWIVFGEASRQEVDLQGQKMITFIGKDKGWMVNPLMGSADAQPLPDDAVKSAAGAMSVGGELFDYKSKGFTATYEGKDSANGAPAYKIKLTKGDYVSTIYLDATTYYIAKNVAKANIMGQTIEQTTNFMDYKKTPEGYVFPHASSVNNPMAGEIKVNVTKIAVNEPLDMKELEKTN